MEKNFIEKVTNLEREKVKYVPKKLFDDVLEQLETVYTINDDVEGLTDVEGYVYSMIKAADENTKEIPIIEDDDKKLDISICPYCGGKMFLRFSDNDRRANRTPYKSYSPIRGGDSIHYKCCYCGAASPNIYLKISLMNEDEVKKDIQKEIEFAMKEVKNEEEGEYDD